MTCRNKNGPRVGCINDRKECFLPLSAGCSVWTAFPAGHGLTDTGPAQTHRRTGPLEHSGKQMTHHSSEAQLLKIQTFSHSVVTILSFVNFNTFHHVH